MALPPLDQVTESLSAGIDPMESAPPQAVAPPPYATKERILQIFNQCKTEALDQRWVLEHDWLRDLNYVSGRQWILYHPARREWVDKKLHKWIPRPVTNKMAETVQAIRSNLVAINLVAKARPAGHDAAAIAAAEIADQMAPLIHEEHDMNQVMREADFWLIVTGSACLQSSWDKDIRSNRLFIKNEQCVQCNTVLPPDQIVNAGNTCPKCGGAQFMDAIGDDGKPIGQWMAHGKGKTVALSPFEYAFPLNCTRWDEVPYVIRMRWRDKSWFEANQPELVNRITWEKAATDRSLQMYRSLALSNTSNTLQGSVTPAGSQSQTEGITEYELWLKPTAEFPEGLVARIVGGSSPIVLDVPEESIPGPFPYKDIEGKPLFPFFFSQYEHVGGRLYGRSAISPLIQKQDQINQLDSLTQLIIQRMANPVWVIPENAGIEHFSGEPGLVMKWNPLAAGGTTAEPKKIEGSEVPSSIQMLRQQNIQDLEELSGAFDIIKGQKPTGVEAFSALQLLVERSQSRFTAVFQARGEMYRRWYSFALEMERQFGPDLRTMTIVGPNRGYTFRHFEHSQLQGQIQIVIEDGSTMPKTTLGKRAAIEQASQLMLLNPNDPDQRYTLLSSFGLQDLVPTLNVHVQTAMRLQDEFEEWAKNPTPDGKHPLVVKPWYDAQVHWTERIKWLNTDRMQELLSSDPMLEQLIYEHLGELQMILTPPVAPDGASEGGGKNPGGQAMSNSNTAGSTKAVPRGNGQGAQNQGPV